MSTAEMTAARTTIEMAVGPEFTLCVVEPFEVVMDALHKGFDWLKLTLPGGEPIFINTSHMATAFPRAERVS